MQPISTESKLATVIKSLAQSEIALEGARLLLAEQEHFEPSTAFKRLDQNRLGELKLNEIVDFLEDNKVSYTQETVAYLFKILDIDHDGRISYQDFQKSVLPRTNHQLKATASLRSPYHIDVGMLLPTEVETSLAELFAVGLQSYGKINIEKQHLVNALDYNSLEALKSNKLFNLGFLTLQSLENFQRLNEQELSNEELSIFFKALDLDDDDRISYGDLIEAVHLKEPLPYTPSASVVIKSDEIERALERANSLERLYLSSYPYYFYPYYPASYPTYFTYLNFNERMRVRENSIERLRNSRFVEIESEYQYQINENQRNRQLERSRSAERLRQIETESIIRQNQIIDNNRIRELDVIRNDELRHSREVIRHIGAQSQLRQIETDNHMKNIAQEHHLHALNQELQVRQIEEERRILHESSHFRNLERLNSFDRLNNFERLSNIDRMNSIERLNNLERIQHLNNISRIELETSASRYYQQSELRYPYQIMDSINAFGMKRLSPAKLARSAIYDSPQKQINPYNSLLRPEPVITTTTTTKLTQSKVTYDSQSGVRRLLI